MPLPRLRTAGLSQAKATYLRELAKHFASGKIVPRRFASMSDDDIRSVLVEVKGIGNWSVDMFLMFGLNRPDILPIGDFAVRKGMAHFFEKKLPLKDRDLVALAEPWRPYRTVASWYMWRVSESL
jgi:DNA-3-methyladenine glycosylase II